MVQQLQLQVQSPPTCRLNEMESVPHESWTDYQIEFNKKKKKNVRCYSAYETQITIVKIKQGPYSLL